MNISALSLMLIVELVITAYTAYFFIKVLFSKPNSEEEDSNS